MSKLADALRDIADWIGKADAELIRLEEENVSLRARAEAAERERDEAYAKGQREFRERAESACLGEEYGRKFADIIKSLPIKERP